MQGVEISSKQCVRVSTRVKGKNNINTIRYDTIR